VADHGRSDSDEAISGEGERHSGTVRVSHEGTRPQEHEAAHGGPPLQAPTPDRILETVLQLNQQVHVEMHEEDIVHAYVESLQELFPERRFVVRLVGAGSTELSLAYATGRLRPDRRDRIEISRVTREQYGLDSGDVTSQGIELVEQYGPSFDDTSQGFDIPLVDGNRLMGVMGVEYRDEVTPPAQDPATIGQVAVQLGAALRNARLLRESVYLRDYLTKLLDHANAPIVVLGRHRQLRVVNQAFLALLGTHREDVLGMDFLQLLPESERNRLLPVFVNALRGRPTVNVELNIPRQDGGDARLAANVAAILSADGDVEGVIAIGRDLTEVRELEEQVIQAEKLATLGQLAAGVVHELNNPLTSISVYADYLLKKYLETTGDDSDAEKLRRIVQSADRILRFTRDLVTYARPSTEEPRFLSLHDELEQAVVFCEHILSEACATVDKRYAEQLPPVYGVKGQLHQVFINLITNAVHAMPEGAGHFVIETTVDDDENAQVLMKDNGSGIPPDDLARIFEPFFTTKGEGRGTGLGLSIVRNIVQQHGGDIHVDSAVGEGTTFKILLPLQSEPGSRPRPG
jgi:PAS domain S-box-containing protein